MIILLLLVRCCCQNSSSSSSSSSSEENFVSRTFSQKTKKGDLKVHFFTTTTQKYAQKIRKELFRTKKRIDR
tara:strand:+ start:32 stop:247 length:216 start_codon:yes stop_codon:yes gene_type:complete